MKSEPESELDRILDEYEEQLKEKTGSAEHAKMEERQFLSDANKVCRKTVRPAIVVDVHRAYMHQR